MVSACKLRELERDNLLLRTIYPVIPPKVEYPTSETK
ncbi:winged helix-turn-helix transcriptional regulator [uncultured Robinsoniella sp.]